MEKHNFPCTSFLKGGSKLCKATGPDSLKMLSDKENALTLE